MNKGLGDLLNNRKRKQWLFVAVQGGDSLTLSMTRSSEEACLGGLRVQEAGNANRIRFVRWRHAWSVKNRERLVIITGPPVLTEAILVQDAMMNEAFGGSMLGGGGFREGTGLGGRFGGGMLDSGMVGRNGGGGGGHASSFSFSSSTFSSSDGRGGTCASCFVQGARIMIL